MKSGSNNVVFFSSCSEKWGGSEELWAQSAELLAEKGYKIHIFKLKVDSEHPQIKKLLAVGCRIINLNEYLPPLSRRIWNRFLPYDSSRTLLFHIRNFMGISLNQLKPKLFVVAQGADFDALPFIRDCHLKTIPYLLIVQKSADYLWAGDDDREWMKEIWSNAVKSFFVSEHNLKLVQEKFGIRLNNAEVVYNPFLSKADEHLSWTFSPNEKTRLACVGRLFASEKGQDILLRVMADKKWRERDIEISFFGQGDNEYGLKDLAKFFELKSVVFKGHVSDVSSIWKKHQALVLPSRAEGLPLVLVEAMHCGRTAITTNVGGNAEVLEDNVTGFISKSVDEYGFDEALERAWQRRHDWENIGKLASEKIRTMVPSNPAGKFAEKLISLMSPN